LKYWSLVYTYMAKIGLYIHIRPLEGNSDSFSKLQLRKLDMRLSTMVLCGPLCWRKLIKFITSGKSSKRSTKWAQSEPPILSRLEMAASWSQDIKIANLIHFALLPSAQKRENIVQMSLGAFSFIGFKKSFLESTRKTSGVDIYFFTSGWFTKTWTWNMHEGTAAVFTFHF